MLNKPVEKYYVDEPDQQLFIIQITVLEEGI